ncbi:DUF5667 domain-containing protein [Actinoplanes sp. NEAU-A12]|uniref:DUF5667 domain-containing protein n=1 Tax=Actinoplanes sandaracinus TaxID=3045177 RepID=A0ABT6WJH5_9ACTN|nr:DUF5667 domain-containing protein [Actinoplanes sandaracinus]MDI6099887.1 DUF5667 domain-containing protein [Actinoplanes sandaracinus]
MKFAFPNSRSAERFAELIDDTGGTRRHHSRGQADEELNRLVAIGSRLSAARPGATVESEFRVGLRAMLVATAERDGIGRTAAEADPEVIVEAAVRRPLFGRRIRARGAIVIGVAAGAMAVSGISAASESASPGDALYSVKRQTERAQLAIAGSDVTRGQLSLDFARTRLSEAVSMKGDEPEFALVLDDMDADTRKGVRLLTTSSVAQRDTKPLATLDGFVTDQRKSFAPAMEKLSTANRERATVSLGLLEDVAQRADDLRTGLGCDKVTPAGSDALGPKLRDCTAGSTGGGGPDVTSSQDQNDKTGTRQGGQTTTPKPSKSGAAVDPAVTGQATVPGKSAGPGVAPAVSGGAATPASGVPVGPLDSGPANEEDGVLGGLLGDLF